MHPIYSVQLCQMHRQDPYLVFLPLFVLSCPHDVSILPWLSINFCNIHSSRAAQRSSTGLPVESNKLPSVSACFVETKSQLDNAAANG